MSKKNKRKYSRENKHCLRNGAFWPGYDNQYKQDNTIDNMMRHPSYDGDDFMVKTRKKYDYGTSFIALYKYNDADSNNRCIYVLQSINGSYCIHIGEHELKMQMLNNRITVHNMSLSNNRGVLNIDGLEPENTDYKFSRDVINGYVAKLKLMGCESVDMGDMVYDLLKNRMNDITPFVLEAIKYIKCVIVSDALFVFIYPELKILYSGVMERIAGWCVDSEIPKIVVIGGSGLISTSDLFAEMVISYLDISKLDTSRVVTAQRMFYDTYIDEIDISSLDLHNVRCFDSMLFSRNLLLIKAFDKKYINRDDAFKMFIEPYNHVNAVYNTCSKVDTDNEFMLQMCKNNDDTEEIDNDDTEEMDNDNVFGMKQTNTYRKIKSSTI